MDHPEFDLGRRIAFDGLRASLGKELSAHLYFLPAARKLILAPIYINFASLDYEKEEVEVVPIDNPASCEEVGRHAYETLLGCERKDRNLRDSVESDWAAYRASGAKSLRQFRRTAYRIQLRTYPVVLEVEGHPPELPDKSISDLNLHVRGYSSLPLGAPDENQKLGTVILRIFRCCQKLHMEGLA
jgi:hypothetical protein